MLNQAREGQEVSVVCVTQPGGARLASREPGRAIVLSPQAPRDQAGHVRSDEKPVLGVEAGYRSHAPDRHTLLCGSGGRQPGESANARGPYRARQGTLYGVGAEAVAGLVGLHADRFFCLSHDMAAALIKHKIVPRWKVQVVDNGIDVDRFGERGEPDALRRSLGISPDSPVIGNVGRLVDVEWHDVLIQSFAELRCAVPGAHLVIVGDGPLKNELLDLIGQLDVGVESPSCRLSSRSLEIPVRHGLLRADESLGGDASSCPGSRGRRAAPRSSRRGWEACPRSSRTAGRAS